MKRCATMRCGRGTPRRADACADDTWAVTTTARLVSKTRRVQLPPTCRASPRPFFARRARERRPSAAYLRAECARAAGAPLASVAGACAICRGRARGRRLRCARAPPFRARTVGPRRHRHMEVSACCAPLTVERSERPVTRRRSSQLSAAAKADNESSLLAALPSELLLRVVRSPRQRAQHAARCNACGLFQVLTWRPRHGLCPAPRAAPRRAGQRIAAAAAVRPA